MSTMGDRSCPNCGNIKGVGKVSALYQKGLQADGIVGQPGRRGPVLDRPMSEMTRKFSPPVKPTAKGQSSYDIRATGFIALLVAALISGALIPFLSLTQITPIFLILFFVGILIATFVSQRQRAAAVRRIPLWEKAMERWDDMYYCMMCDGVYIPGERLFVPIAQKDALAYQSDALKLDKPKQSA